MNNTQDKFEKVFTCELKGISAMLDVCMEYVDKHEASCPGIPEVRSRLKWAITELLTNAIKHSGAPECTICIHCNPERLVLEKTEQGSPLTLTSWDSASRLSWPLSPEQTEGFEIYQNGADSLWVDISDYGHVRFFVKPITEVEMPALSEHIAEHFGLLILTKASDAFSYQYEEATSTNRFNCTFNWKKK